MTDKVQQYIKFWSAKAQALREEIATKKRSLELAEAKLADPEKHMAREIGRGAVKVSKALGLETVKKPKVVLKKNVEGKGDVPDPGSKGSGPAAAPPAEEKKSGWGFF